MLREGNELSIATVGGDLLRVSSMMTPRVLASSSVHIAPSGYTKLNQTDGYGYIKWCKPNQAEDVHGRGAMC